MIIEHVYLQILTGQEPYTNITGDKLRRHNEKNKTPDEFPPFKIGNKINDEIPEPLQILMKKCWQIRKFNQSTGGRPTASEVVEYLRKLDC